MHLSTTRWLLAGGGGALLLLSGGPALAEAPVPDACRQECRRDRGQCLVASVVAFRDCRAACQEGDAACLRSCVADFERAGLACRDDLVECGVACGHELDPVCAATCREDLGDCREELAACAGGCGEQAFAALQQCRQAAVAGGGDARACVREALEAGAQCRKDCHAELSCLPEFRACLGTCAVPE
jgi:hypothetical protein